MSESLSGAASGRIVEMEREAEGRLAALKRDDCPFCDYAGPNMVLYADNKAYVVEPLRQVTPGHVLVIPYVHAADFADIPTASSDAMATAAYFVQAEEIGDCNLITSRGPSASQTVHHVHIHILPRHWGDDVTLPWHNPNQPPTWGRPGQVRYLLHIMELGVKTTHTRLALSAEEAIYDWVSEHAAGRVLKVERMFPDKEEH